MKHLLSPIFIAVMAAMLAGSASAASIASITGGGTKAYTARGNNRITFTVTLDETATAVTGGAPTLTLSGIDNADTDPAQATYTGIASGKLMFRYTVRAGDYSAGIGISSLDLNGATVTTAGGTLDDPPALPAGAVLDGETITIRSISFLEGNKRPYELVATNNVDNVRQVTVSLGAAATVDQEFEVEASDYDKVDVDPDFTIPAGASDGSVAITMREETDTPVTVTIHPVGYGVVTDADLVLTLTIGKFGIVSVKAVTPDGVYNSGDIKIEVTLSGAITDVGTQKPTLKLKMSPGNRVATLDGDLADYVGSSSLTFNYTIVPGDFAVDLCCSAGTFPSGLRIDGVALSIGNWTAMPADGAADSLSANSDIGIETVFIVGSTPPREASLTGKVDEAPIQVVITRSGAIDSDMYFEFPSPATAYVDYQSTFSIPAGQTAATLTLTPKAPTTSGSPATLTIRPRAYGYPTDGSGDITLNLTIEASAIAAAIDITGSDRVYEGTNEFAITVQLTKPPKETTTVTVESSNPDSLLVRSWRKSNGQTGAASADFSSAQLTFEKETTATYQIFLQPLDGLADGLNKVTISAAASGGAYEPRYYDIYVLNENPGVKVEPIDSDSGEWVLTGWSARTESVISWLATDASRIDLEAGIVAIVDFGDGTPSNVVTCSASGFGSVGHTYRDANGNPEDKSGGYGVTIRLIDKDGGEKIQRGRVIVDPPATATIREYKRLEGNTGRLYYASAAHGGIMQGMGEGSVIDFVNSERENINAFYTWHSFYNKGQGAVIFKGVPADFIDEDPHADGADAIYNSFFHVWQGPDFTTEDVLDPAFHLINASVVIDLDTASVTVGGVFSREHYPEDGCADIDNDELPDDWEDMVFPGQYAFEHQGGSDETPWGRDDNPDMDFLPRCVESVDPVTGEFVITKDKTLAVNFTPDGLPFINVYEVRGTHWGLNMDPEQTQVESTAVVTNRTVFGKAYANGADPTDPDAEFTLTTNRINVADENIYTNLTVTVGGVESIVNLFDAAENDVVGPVVIAGADTYYFWADETVETTVVHYAVPVEPQDEPHYGAYDENTYAFTDAGTGNTRHPFYGTHPNMADTDGDRLTDGYEYFFWRSARFATETIGYAYSPTLVIEGTAIPNGLIEATFNPCVPNDHLAVDTDGDGLSNFEEMLLGTNPIHWDTDGDTMNDGWEVMWGLNPFGDDSKENPDGDYMAADPTGRRHFQIYQDYGFDPRTAVNATYLERNRTTTIPAPNTQGFSNYEEHYLARFLIDNMMAVSAPPISLCVMTQPVPYGTTRHLVLENNDAEPKHHVPYTSVETTGTGDSNTNENEYTVPYGSMSYLVQNDVIVPHGCDTDSDGMPDGWELYCYVNPDGPGLDPWSFSPKDNSPHDYDGDMLTNGEEFKSVDSYDYYGSICTNGLFNYTGNWYNKWWPTDPFNTDTDHDHIMDGLEGYGDEPSFMYQTWRPDPDGGTLLDQLRERFAETIRRGHVPGGGLNPCSVDTDMDYIPDHFEYQYYGYNRDTDWEGGFVNTPGDESSFGTSDPHFAGGGMDGTYFDSCDWYDEYEGILGATSNKVYVMHGNEVWRRFDFDGDGLQNYQEYLVNGLFHLQYEKWAKKYYQENGGAIGDYGSYDIAEIFNGEFGQLDYVPWHLQGNTWVRMNRVFYKWDWAAYCDDWQNLGMLAPANIMGIPIYPFSYMPSERRPDPVGPYLYASSDPRLADSDGDNMDDFWELFHGLNPILSDMADYCNQVIRYPEYSGRGDIYEIYDFTVAPWLAGMPNADPDGDDLPNWEEALSPNNPAPKNHNTDPSPLWMTDISYAQSFVNLYYNWGTQMNFWCPNDEMSSVYMIHPLPDMMLGGARPNYIYSFECNEGFDTDNDNLSDAYELHGAAGGVTEAQNTDRPVGRKALYLDGKGAARTRSLVAFGMNALRSWTIEAWVMPEKPASGSMQVIMERPVNWDDGSIAPTYEDIRRTFRLGLTATGVPFVEFDNGGKNIITERAVAPEGSALSAGKWYHLAATMDGFQGKLALYIDGKRVASKTTVAIPYTGFTYSDLNGIGGEFHRVRYAPLVIGAADANPAGKVDGSLYYHNGDILDINGSQPELKNYFKGWIDEVHVWNGARPGGDDASADLRVTKWRWPTIKDDVVDFKRYGIQESIEARNDAVKYFERVVDTRKRKIEATAATNAGSTNAPANVSWIIDGDGLTFEEFYDAATRYIQLTGGEDNEIRIPPVLLCSYNFDNLPDPELEPLMPAKFASLNNRPLNYTGIPWLRGALDRTTVYTSAEAPYQFSHNMENMVAAFPLGRLRQAGMDEEYREISGDAAAAIPIFRHRAEEVANSKYWTRNTKGGIPLNELSAYEELEGDMFNDFPNNANPYGYQYITANSIIEELHPHVQAMEAFDQVYSVLYNDLIPLRTAKSDMSVTLWDDPAGTGVGTTVDHDGDGLLDWWEYANGMDPYNADENGNGVRDDRDDFDGDGLNNWYEYLAGTDPWDATTDGVNLDRYADPDGDGLTNEEELQLGTHPAHRDTDDDGIPDGDEIVAGTDPCNSLDQFKQNYLRNDGDGVLLMPGRIPVRKLDGTYVDRYGTRLNLEKWTIDMAVRPAIAYADDADVVLLSRPVDVDGSIYVNYEIGLSNNIPYVRFQTDGGKECRVSGIEPLAANEWTFVGGRYNGKKLTLFVDGVPYSMEFSDASCATGNAPEENGEVVVSDHFAGDIDEVRIWTTAISDTKYKGYYDECIFVGKDIVRNGSLNCDTNATRTLTFDDELQPVDSMTVEGWFRVSLDENGDPGSDDKLLVLRANYAESSESYRITILGGGENAGKLSAKATGFYTVNQQRIQVPIEVISANRVDDGEWHHFALVAKAGTSDASKIWTALYIDGVPDTKGNYDGQVQSYVQYWAPGEIVSLASVRQGNNTYRGLIDEFRVWSKDFELSTIRDRMNGVIDLTRGVYDDLAIYFDFDDFDAEELPLKVQNRANAMQYAYIVANTDQPISEVNAPVQFNPVSAISKRLALYLPFEDGRLYCDEAERTFGHVEDFSHRILGMKEATYMYNENFCGWLSETNHIDFRQYEREADPPPFRDYYTMDTDGDLLPDWWEHTFGLNPWWNDEGGAADSGPDGDPDHMDDFDGDGLSNFTEFLAGTDPRFWSTYEDGVSDAMRDSDGDGLTNLQEQNLGTHPGRADTDDDGVDDGSEVAFGSAPLNPLDPFRARAIALRGSEDDYVEASGTRVPDPDTGYLVDIAQRYLVTNQAFVLSASVMPTAYPVAKATIVAHEIAGGMRNYYIELGSNGVVSAGFTMVDGSDFALSAPLFRALPSNAWTRVTFAYDPKAMTASLSLNDDEVAQAPVHYTPATIPQSLRKKVVFGRGLSGYLRGVSLSVPGEGEQGDTYIFNYTFNDGTSYDVTAGGGTFGDTAVFTAQAEDSAYGVDVSDDYAATPLRYRVFRYASADLKGNARFVDLDENLVPIIDPALDTDGDGLPDVWEIANGLNPYSSDTDGDGVLDGEEDDDLDGLQNRFEYLAGTNPRNAKTNGMLFDGDDDTDGDGLINVEEQRYGADPGVADTDDDGIADDGEVMGRDFSLPTSGLSPARQGVLVTDGTGYAAFTNASSMTALRIDGSWAVEAWVKPDSASETGYIVIRGADNGAVNYAIGLDGGKPYAMIAGIYDGQPDPNLEVKAAADFAIVSGDWTHVAGSWNATTRNLALYVDGVLAATVEKREIDEGVFAMDGLMPVVIGQGISGSIDEVRIWDIPRSGTSIGATAYKTFEHASARPVAELRFDDFGDFADNTGSAADALAGNRLVASRSVAALLDGAVMAEDDTSPIAIDEYVDSDADHIPDFWEVAIFGSTIECDPAGDDDGDGLSNLYEYWSSTYPLLKYTGASDVIDAQRDLDGDNLTNVEEQGHGTRPDMEDTDLDGWDDWTEITGVTPGRSENVGVSDPLNPLSPAIPRALSVDGADYVSVPERDGRALACWTVSAWIKPDASATDGRIVRREYKDGSVNYEIGVETVGGVLVPYAQYTAEAAAGDLELVKAGLGEDGTTVRDGNGNWLALGTNWTHIAATYASTNGVGVVTNGILTLYIDGTAVAWRQDALYEPFLGAGADLPLAAKTIVGEGFKGLVDDVRIAASAVSATDVVAMMGGSPLLVNGGTTISNEVASAAAAAAESISGDFIVRFRDGVTRTASAATVTALGGTVRRTYSIINAAHVTVPDGVDAAAFAAALSADASVAYVEKNMKVSIDKTPNDSDYSKLWGMNNAGQTGGTAGCDIKAEVAWDYLTGSENVVIAVIDTGVDYNHPDLAANMWTNPGEIPGNGVDDDGNGYVDDVYGWNFVTGAPNGDPMDDHSHGTHCAGTIAGVGNNGAGVAGVNWKAKIMALKFLSASGGGSTADAIGCVDYAVQMGAKLTSNSWGGGGYSQALYDSIKAAGEAGLIFIAAAGNDGTDNDVMPHYPSSYDLDCIVAVAATDHNDGIASFSCYGATSVDIGAPGVDIYSTVPTAFGSYDTFSGTSMATPHVSGAVGLMLAADPTLTPDRIKALLMEYADPVDSLAGKCVSGARLNIGAIIPVIWNPGGDEPVIPGTRALAAHYRFDGGAAGVVHDFAKVFSVAKPAAYVGYFSGAGAEAVANDPADTLMLGRYFGDADEDGLPDWWELMFGFSPVDAASGDGRTGDPDGDGIDNLHEFLASLANFKAGQRGLDPLVADTDNDGTSDYDEDSDGDGLTNGEEQDTYMTNPGAANTDDDDIPDGEELVTGFDPTDSLKPYVAQALDFGGAADEAENTVVVKDKVDGVFTERFSSDEWTVEGWFNPAATSLSGDYRLVSRALFSTGAANFELGLSDGKPYARYTDHTGADEVRIAAGSAIEAGKWTHVAARLEKTGEAAMNVLSILVNGERVVSTRSGVVPATGPGDLVFGSVGFKGQMFDMRVWKTAQSDETIKGMMQNELIGGNVEDLSGVLTVSGNGHLKETAVTTKANGDPIDNFTGQWTLECWVKTEATEGILVARRSQSGETEDRFNYCIEINPNGCVTARFAEWYYYWTVIDRVVSLVYGEDYHANDLVGEVRVNDGLWHHVAYVRTAKQCILYIDGKLDASQSNLVRPDDEHEIDTFGILAEPGPVVIGERLAGSLDEVRIWNRDLTSAEIEDYRMRNLSGGEDGLVSYFNFDFQKEDDRADERSYLRDPVHEYGLYIGDAVRNVSDVGPSIVVSPLRSIQGLSLAGSFIARDGGETLEDRTRPIGDSPFTNWKYAGRRASGAAVPFAEQNPVSWVAYVDSDGDGMLDQWEIAHGFAPYNSDEDDNGVIDGYDDADNDGLRNEAEMRAGTEPHNPDDDGDGIPDFYDEAPGAGGLSYGFVYTDYDYVLDGYELAWDDIFASPFRYDEDEDRDLDGWDNWSEALSGTILAYNSYNENGEPAVYEAYSYSTGVYNLNGNTTTYEEGSVSVLRTNATGTAESSIEDKSANFPLPDLNVTLDYHGDAISGAKLVIHAYGRSDMNGWPDAVFVKEFPESLDTWPMTVTIGKDELIFGHLRQGRNWFFAWMEKDGSVLNVNGGNWPTWTDPEPAAIADNQLDGIDIGFDYNEVTFHLTDKAESFARVSWQNYDYPDGDGMALAFKYQNSVVFYKFFQWPRTWIHEGDIIDYNNAAPQGGKDFGLASTNGVASDRQPRQILTFVGSETDMASGILYNPESVGVVTNWMHSALPKPEIYAPVNNEISGSAAVEFKFSLDPEYTEFKFELKKGVKLIYDKRVLAPGRFWNAATGRRDLVVWRFPYCVDDKIPASEVSSGVSYHFSPDATYTWKVTAYSPALKTGAAAQQSANGTFQTSAASATSVGSAYASTGFGAIDVDVKYPSTMVSFPNSGTPFIRVQAFKSKSFNGLPDASIAVNNVGTYRLYGLQAGQSYYLRAYVEQTDDCVRDGFESWGYYRAGNAAINPFVPIAVKATTTGNASAPYEIVIRDCDTDNDLVPDAYEMARFGNLAKGVAESGFTAKVEAGMTLRSTMSVSPALSAETEEIIENATDKALAGRSSTGFISPYAVHRLAVAATDTDGDGLADYDEDMWYDTNPQAADTDSDGIRDGLEVALFGANLEGEQKLVVKSVSFANGEPVIEWGWDGAEEATGRRSAQSASATAVTYVVEAKASLTDPEWTTVRKVSTTSLDGSTTDETAVVPEGVDISAFRFFRVRVTNGK